MSASLRYVLGSLLGLALFCGVAFWLVIDAEKYDREHPIVCMKEGTIKEILAIEKGYAKVKLESEESEETVPYQILHRSGGKSYTIDIKAKDIICLGYGRK